MHPILDALDATPHEWLKKLLFTFNEGSIGKFEALAPVFPQEVSTHFEEIVHCSADTTYAADLAAELLVLASKDLPHGTYRVHIQAKCR